MNKEQIESRIAQINGELQKIVTQHTQLMGHLEEAKHWLSTIVKIGEEVKEAITE